MFTFWMKERNLRIISELKILNIKPEDLFTTFHRSVVKSKITVFIHNEYLNCF